MTKDEKDRLMQMVYDLRKATIERESKQKQGIENFYKEIKKEVDWKRDYYKEGCQNSKIGSTIRIIYEAKLQVANDILDYLEFYYRNDGKDL